LLLETSLLGQLLLTLILLLDLALLLIAGRNQMFPRSRNRQEIHHEIRLTQTLALQQRTQIKLQFVLPILDHFAAVLVHLFLGELWNDELVVGLQLLELVIGFDQLQHIGVQC